jgi:hypothetical protein
MNRLRVCAGALLLFLCAATEVAAQFPPPPQLPPPPPIQDPRQGGTTTNRDGVFARPVVVVGPVLLLGPKYAVDFTVCNVDERALYSTTVSPGQETGVYVGNPPEHFAPMNYSQTGSSMNPPCPTNLLHKAGLKPYDPPLRGDRPCGGNRTHTITVTAFRDGQEKTGTATYTVSSIGPCPSAPPAPPPPPKLPAPPKPPRIPPVH